MSAAPRAYPIDAKAVRPLATEPHFRVDQIVELWGWSEATVRKVFAKEPGVLALGRPQSERRGRQAYRTLSIPQSVLERVHRRMENT